MKPELSMNDLLLDELREQLKEALKKSPVDGDVIKKLSSQIHQVKQLLRLQYE